MAEKKLGMLIELSRCIGCNACTIACTMENGVPVGMRNTWVESWDAGEDGSIVRVNLPKLCNHCEDAPCVASCPTGASYVSEDGVVLVDEDLCIGCMTCATACPFGVRYKNDELNVAGKCTYCYHRSSEGLLPACVGTCVSKARYFGDMNDPQSDISKRLAQLKVESLGDGAGISTATNYVCLELAQSLPKRSGVVNGGRVSLKLGEDQ